MKISSSNKEKRITYDNFDLKDLERLKTLQDVYNDLCRVTDKLYTVAADAENTELFLKLNKIINTVLQAKFELADDVLEPFENFLKGSKNANS